LYWLMNETYAERLIGLARGGDEQAFESLVEPLLEPSFRLACGILLDRAAAEDAVQEATFKAWRALPRLRADTTSLRPWFLTIVANQCRSMRRNRWGSVLRGFVDGAGSAGAGSVGASAEVAVAAQVDLAVALRRLDGRSRATVVLRFYLDLSFDEMARVLGGSPQAAKSRLYRSLKAMRPFVEVWTDQEDERR
jgi:RNA polymerase sigma-70 factor (ECF subfamily)